MVIFVGRPQTAEELYEVSAHEVGHEWFPMMVGQDEAAHAFMDEGFTTFYERLAVADFVRPQDPWLGAGAEIVLRDPSLGVRLLPQCQPFRREGHGRRLASTLRRSSVDSSQVDRLARLLIALARSSDRNS